MLSPAAPLLLVGAGKMGGAMLERWLERGLDAKDVAVLDPHVERGLNALLTAAGAEISADAAGLRSRRLATLMLAVKPQIMADALAAAAPLAAADTLVVSVAAGVRMEKLAAAFPPGQPIVRVMPNTPAQVGMGMSVAVANAAVSQAQRETVDALLSAIGKVAWTHDEALLDAVTAVSGSGPAYAFLLAECLAEAARHAGLPADLADTLARQTVVGAGALLGASPLPAAELRQNVTSPNGTTAAALAVLMAEDGLQPLMTRAVAAAKRRSIELG
jgi:pyrroline-5-carboxylate reductase